MSHYKPYSAYKDSGVEWLGKVPEHWASGRFDAKTKTHRDTIYAESLNGLQVLHYSIPSIQEFGHALVENGSEIDSAKLIINEQQLLVSKLNPHKQTLVVAGKSKILTVASTEFVPLIPICSDLEYLTYVWQSTYCLHYMLARCESSTRSHQRVSPEDITRMRWMWPSLEEQRAIATHLDRETTRIDTLIAKKTRFIELLKEKRQALITQAVTKGLNPNVKMKDSGVEWLGEVPDHWAVRRLKFIAQVQTGIAKGKDNAGVKTVEVPYLRVANVQDGYLDLDDVTLIEVSAADVPRYLLKAGDVLMNEGGDFDKLGRGHVWSGEIDPCIHQNHVFAVRPHRVSSQWLNAFTGSAPAQFYFMGRAKQSTNLASISSSNLMELSVPLPPADEQKYILSQLSLMLARLDATNSKTELSITLLKERRSALITAAVTGQIDLREAA